MKNLLLLAITLFVSLNIMAQQNTIQTVDLYSKNDVVYSIDISELDSINFVRSNSIIQTTTKPTHEGFEYVDMGLSVKWATCNVGGSKPGDSGDAFVWGETEPAESGRACVQIKTATLDKNNDAANVNWGGNWRMPTKEELEELLLNCDILYVTEKNSKNMDVLGYMFISRVNGNSVFFPYVIQPYIIPGYDATRNFTKILFYFSSSTMYDDVRDLYMPFVLRELDDFITISNSYQCDERLGSVRPVLP